MGGTILVYEVAAEDNAQATDDEIAALYQRWLEQGGWEHIIVRAVGRKRLEFSLPRTADHAAQVANLKQLISRNGTLEFRILANGHDDLAAIKDAEEQIARIDPAKLSEYAQKGIPPPGPLLDQLGQEAVQDCSRPRRKQRREL